MKTEFKPKHVANLTSLMKKAEDFHGHLGPFLVFGLRIGLIGLRELGVSRNNKELRVTVMLKPYRVPFTCVIDGLQVSTNCTIGNQRLELKESPGIAVKFRLENKGKKITVSLNPVMFEKLKERLLDDEATMMDVRQLAFEVASIPEEELFIVE